METNRLAFHLKRTTDKTPQIDALATALGGRVGLADVAENLTFRARNSWAGRFWGRAVEHAVTWNAHDNADPIWWPQGITTSADASVEGRWRGRRLALTTWYAKPRDGITRGARISVLDLDTLRYRHVLLVDATTDEAGQPSMKAVTIHAGGIVWAGDWLHVAATGRGFLTFHLDDVMRVRDDNRHPHAIGRVTGAEPAMASFGHHYVLPARFTHRATTEKGAERLRYSFLSLDRAATPPALIAGEYGRGDQSTRLVRYDLDPDTSLPATDSEGKAHPVPIGEGVAQMQGAVMAAGRLHLSVSRGPITPGSLYTGEPQALRHRLFAQPMGPEDLAYSPGDDLIWSVSEHPRRRWVYAMRRAWFD